jgi:glycosyltransferase involved in cell wall biosynthesis
MKCKGTIFIVSNNVWTIYKFRREMIIRLLELGYSVSFLATFDNQKYVDDLESIGANFINIKFSRKGMNVANDLHSFFLLLSVYFRLKPDFVIHYTIKPNIYGGWAARIVNTPYIGMITGIGNVFISGSEILKKIVFKMYKLSLSSSQLVWFTNNSDRDMFVNNHIVSKERSGIVPGSGVDTLYFSPLSASVNNNKFVFLMIARLQRPKGIYEYIEAAKSLRVKMGSRVEFQVLGGVDSKNPDALSLDEIVEFHNQKIINYLGEADNVKDYIGNSDCVVLPSYREGLSTTLIEAASMERPLITSDVPGCHDVVIDNHNGYLCKPKNHRDLESKMMLMYYTPKEKRREFGSNGRKIVKNNFDKREVVDYQVKQIEFFLNKCRIV